VEEVADGADGGEFLGRQADSQLPFHLHHEPDDVDRVEAEALADLDFVGDRGDFFAHVVFEVGKEGTAKRLAVRDDRTILGVELSSPPGVLPGGERGDERRAGRTARPAGTLSDRDGTTKCDCGGRRLGLWEGRIYPQMTRIAADEERKNGEWENGNEFDIV